MKKHRKLKITLLSLGAFVIICAAAMGIYAADYLHAGDAAKEALISSDTVKVEVGDDYLYFSPIEPTAGLIFYPGGKVEFTAYAPLMRELAENGIMCIVPEVTMNLAIMEPNAADGLRESCPLIDTWYIGGHSLGGYAASGYGADNDFDGLLLLASYPSKDLGDMKLLSLYGSEDKVLNMENYEEGRKFFPEDTMEFIIEGGNHAQFGDYGLQKGDGTAAISPEEQVDITAELILEWMNE